MAAANRTTYAILGLLAQGPKSGYAIKRAVEQTINHFWKESFGHIYPTLSRLAAEGLVEREERAGASARESQPYRITAAGSAALRAWLEAPVEPEGVRNELALKLYFGEQAPLAVSRGHLEAHRAQHQARLAQLAAERPGLEAAAAAGEPEASFALITLELGLHISAARVAWCEAAIVRLDALAAQELAP